MRRIADDPASWSWPEDVARRARDAGPCAVVPVPLGAAEVKLQTPEHNTTELLRDGDCNPGPFSPIPPDP